MKLTRRGFVGLAAPVLAGGQDFAKISIQRVDAGFDYAEGPAWSREGFLVFSDTVKGELRKLTPGSRSERYRAEANGPAGNAFDAQGRLYTCETHARRVVRLDRKGQIETVAAAWEGKRLNAPNEIAVRKDGHVFFTDPAFGKQADTRELDFHGVFHVPPRGPLTTLARWQTRPHGIALSGDGRQLFVANADERNIRVFTLDKDGKASAERVFVSGIDGPPAGIRLDERGNVYVAASGLTVYSPEGIKLASWELGEPPSNCEFGDADRMTLYITARTSLYRIRMTVKGAVSY